MNLKRLGLILFAVLGISISSCKKDNLPESSSDTSTIQQLSKDENNIEAASEDATKDVNSVLTPASAKSRFIPANATITDTIINDTIIYTITFNGRNGNNRLNRTGVMIIKKSNLTNWSVAGNKAYITFVNYTVTKVASGKSITLNGTKLFKNVSGGFMRDLGHGDTTIVQEVSGALSLTFDDGTTRVWNIARRKTFTGTAPLQINMTIDGFGTDGTNTNLETWGVNRHGDNFYTKVISPIVFRETCNGDPCLGNVTHVIASIRASATVTYGYDSNNNLIPAPYTSCPDRYRFDWVRNGHTGTMYIQL